MIDSFQGEYRFLSNFYVLPLRLIYDGIEFTTSEHAFQAAKTLDFEARKVIASLEKPGEAKRYGKKVELRPDWDKIRVGVMLEILLQKFAQPELCKKLLATGDQVLVEGNTWGDTFWGVCNGIGENQLGEALMDIRFLFRRLVNENVLCNN